MRLPTRLSGTIVVEAEGLTDPAFVDLAEDDLSATVLLSDIPFACFDACVSMNRFLELLCASGASGVSRVKGAARVKGDSAKKLLLVGVFKVTKTLVGM